MDLFEALQDASVIEINGDVIQKFEMADQGKTLEDGMFFNGYREDDEKPSFFMSQAGIENAVFHSDGYWETACGIIECYVLTNIVDAI